MDDSFYSRNSSYCWFLLATRYLNINTEEFVYNVTRYHGFQQEWYDHDSLLKYGFVVFALIFVLSKNSQSRSIVGMVLVLYVLVWKEIFTVLLTITSFNYFFVTMRTVSSIQYLILFFLGICALRIYYILKSCAGLFVVCVFFPS